MNEPTRSRRGQSENAPLIQIPVRFVPAAAEAIRAVALHRSTSASIVLCDAVAGLIDEASTSEEIRAELITAAQASPHGQPDTPDNASDPGWPDGAQRLRAYIPKRLVDQLDILSAASSLSRTQVVRFAIDREVDGPGAVRS